MTCHDVMYDVISDDEFSFDAFRTAYGRAVSARIEEHVRGLRRGLAH